MDILALADAATHLIENLDTDAGALTHKIETGLDSIADSIKTIAKVSNDNSSMVSLLDNMNSIIHSKIDGALLIFHQLGALAISLAKKGEAALAELQRIYNLMISILQALRPVEAIIVALYPVLGPLFAALNSLPQVA